MKVNNRKFYIISCHVLWRELCYFAALSPNIFQFNFLKQGLHSFPDLLRQEVQNAIDRVEDDYDAILIGYGLCSNGLVGIQARNVPLVVMRGHDCITFWLGSKDYYRQYFDSHPGTYWYTPGWIETSTQPGKERYETVLRQYTETYGEENARYLMEASENWMTSYNNAAYVDLGVGPNETYKQFTTECADWLRWKTDFIEGDPRLMRDFVNGAWDNERFLIVPPGETIIASHDEATIIAAKGKEDSGKVAQ